MPRECSNVGLVPSLAKGGLSNVWGAAVLPYLADELDEWPIRYEQLVPHYRAVLSLTSLSAVNDDLAARFPLFSDDYSPLVPSRQAAALLADLACNRQALEARGIRFGASRLAVRGRNNDGRPCAACGLCMYGCPYGLIYNSQDTLAELCRMPGFTYRGGVIVRRFSESGETVRIFARSLADGRPLQFEGTSLYVAAGVLSSTRLLLDSLEAYDRTLTILDSQYFLLPMLRNRPVAGATDEAIHTLSQIFLELFDDRLSAKSIHLQVYTYNELYRQAIRAALGPFDRPLSFAVRRFLERFLLIQGYLHSDISGRIELKLRPPHGDEPSRLQLVGKSNPVARRVVKKIVGKLRSCRSLLKAFPLSPLLKIGEPGRGFHSGGTLPMRAKPGPLETDPLGRPEGFRHVHIVDSSIFPSINANTVTLTVMANAHRIASLHGAGNASRGGELHGALSGS